MRFDLIIKLNLVIFCGIHSIFQCETLTFANGHGKNNYLGVFLDR